MVGRGLCHLGNLAHLANNWLSTHHLSLLANMWRWTKHHLLVDRHSLCYCGAGPGRRAFELVYYRRGIITAGCVTGTISLELVMVPDNNCGDSADCCLECLDARFFAWDYVWLALCPGCSYHSCDAYRAFARDASGACGAGGLEHLTDAVAVLAADTGLYDPVCAHLCLTVHLARPASSYAPLAIHPFASDTGFGRIRAGDTDDYYTGRTLCCIWNAGAYGSGSAASIGRAAVLVWVFADGEEAAALVFLWLRSFALTGCTMGTVGVGADTSRLAYVGPRLLPGSCGAISVT